MCYKKPLLLCIFLDCQKFIGTVNIIGWLAGYGLTTLLHKKGDTAL